MRDVGGSSGYDPRVSYSLPANPAADACAAAQRWLEEHHPLYEPIDRGTLADWLIMLGTNTAGSTKLTEADVRAKIAAYAFALSDEPAYLFTAQTLKAACKHFTWFPSVAELCQFLKTQCREQDEQVSLAKRLAERGALAELKRRAV